MVVAGAERFSGMGFVLNQGAVYRCGIEIKGYWKTFWINGLKDILTTNDDFWRSFGRFLDSFVFNGLRDSFGPAIVNNDRQNDSGIVPAPVSGWFSGIPGRRGGQRWAVSPGAVIAYFGP
jgi:hypothetical protein